MSPKDLEAGIFYCRLPDSPRRDEVDIESPIDYELEALRQVERDIEDEVQAAREEWEREIARAEHDAAWEEAVAAGFIRLVPHDAKRLTDVGGVPDSPVEMVVEDLIPDGQVILLCAEEGTGKSWLEHQLAAEMVAGGKALGHFNIPRPVRSVLIVDVEQSEEDVRIIRDEMLRRGVLKADAPVYWLDASDRAFDVPEDIAWLIQQVAIYRPEVLFIDTVTDAVTDPVDDKAVRKVMALLRWFVKDAGVRAVIGTAQPRKTGQAADAKGRSFDSLFGSRAWKSKPSAVFWLTESRLTVWKQRGRYLQRRWGKPDDAKYAYGSLERPETGSPTVAGPPGDEDERRTGAARVKAMKLVEERPDHYSKDQLSQAVGGNAEIARAAVDDLIRSGTVQGRFRDGKLVRGAKLTVADLPQFH
jgi:archaellum biogenesis ATPase FlaH